MASVDKIEEEVESPGKQSATHGYYHRYIETTTRKLAFFISQINLNKILIHFHLGESYCNQLINIWF